MRSGEWAGGRGGFPLLVLASDRKAVRGNLLCFVQALKQDQQFPGTIPMQRKQKEKISVSSRRYADVVHLQGFPTTQGVVERLRAIFPTLRHEVT